MKIEQGLPQASTRIPHEGPSLPIRVHIVDDPPSRHVTALMDVSVEEIKVLRAWRRCEERPLRDEPEPEEGPHQSPTVARLVQNRGDQQRAKGGRYGRVKQRQSSEPVCLEDLPPHGDQFLRRCQRAESLDLGLGQVHVIHLVPHLLPDASVGRKGHGDQD